ncbi:hypothetical protein [Mixta calida]|uniref:hypothetical protein n=1 Tax=Mixta calida TaxID=665913 RepID=UPI002FDD54F5
MKVEYLLIGNGLTGEVKSYDYSEGKLEVKEIKVIPANGVTPGNPVRVFSVVHHLYNGKLYAVGIASDTDSLQIEGLIDKTRINPIPQELL